MKYYNQHGHPGGPRNQGGYSIPPEKYTRIEPNASQMNQDAPHQSLDKPSDLPLPPRRRWRKHGINIIIRYRLTRCPRPRPQPAIASSPDQVPGASLSVQSSGDKKKEERRLTQSPPPPPPKPAPPTPHQPPPPPDSPPRPSSRPTTSSALHPPSPPSAPVPLSQWVASAPQSPSPSPSQSAPPCSLSKKHFHSHSQQQPPPQQQPQTPSPRLQTPPRSPRP